MNDEYTSKHAQELLENQLFKDAFANVRENIVSQLECCPLDNDILRNQLVLSLQLLIAIKGDIENQIAIFD